MRKRKPEFQTVDVSEIQNQVSRLIEMVSRNTTRVLVEERGVLVAAVISAGDLERLEALDAEWEETTRSLERISQTFADVPIEELEAKIDEIIAEGRSNHMGERRSA